MQAREVSDVEHDYKMRAPCRVCGSEVGRIETRGGQDCVFCVCGRLCYNAPKTETGRAPRTVTTVHNGIKPGKRSRILERANGACEICHAANRPLHVGHIVSVAEGVKAGMSDLEINSDENLAAMCEECNLGQADRPVSLRMLMAVLKARLQFTGGVA